MYTIIQKQPKIQLFHFQNPTSSGIKESFSNHNNDVNNPVYQYLEQFKQRNKVNEILSGESYATELGSYNLGAPLTTYFSEHRSAWYELKRKMHAFKKFAKDKGGWYIAKEDEDKLLSIFIRQGDTIGLNEQIEEDFRKNILRNQGLMYRIQREPSLLDSSHGEIKSVSLKQRIGFIKNIIEYGILSNSDGNEANMEERFLEIFPVIKKYLKSIYHIEFPNSDGIQDICALASYIVDMIWKTDRKDIEAKNGWMLAKAFTAWGGYPEFKAMQEQAKQSIQGLPDTLRNNGIITSQLTHETREIDDEEFTITKGEARCSIDGVSHVFNIEFRVKSLRSIFLKLGENEDYNNGDALRDMVGIALITPDVMETSICLEILKRFTSIMYLKGYLAKDKGLFSIKGGAPSVPDEAKGGDFSDSPPEEKTEKKKREKEGKMKNPFKEMLQGVDNKPFGKIVTAKGLKSSDGFANASLSGIGNLGDGIPTGVEVQMHTQASADYWKKDHYTFDPLKVVKGWARGSWFITPHQLQNTIKHEIPGDIMNSIIKKTPNGIMWWYISRHKILTYISDKKEVFLVIKDHKSEFEAKMPATMHWIEKPQEYDGLKNFIEALGSEQLKNEPLSIS